MFAAAALMAVRSAGGSGTASAADRIAEKAKLCATCHGEQGIPINKQTPVIWGQNEGYSICSYATSRAARARTT